VSIEECRAWWLSIPLHTPYFTSRAPSGRTAFDVLLVRVRTASGATGWGEACPVDGGYSPETPETGWEALCRLASGLRRLGAPEASRRLAAEQHDFPFVVSAIREALAAAHRSDLLRPLEAPASIALAGTVNTLNREDAPRIARSLVAEGYTTLKVKVGLEPASDAARVRDIAEAIGGNARLRVDANRGYTEAQALAFGRGVPEEAIEVFEQPLAASDWAGMERLARLLPLPIMLDESIYGPDDIRRASGWARGVKIKMSKAGGPEALVDQIRLATGLGLSVVVGNGIATDFGCYHEALCCLRAGVGTAGEFNGFLKLSERLLATSLGVENGRLIVQPSVSDDLGAETFAHLAQRTF
jgi:L-alanine-DL-glutamate epimerase-like enolase superfamily enzyme